jgi:hypothetical protein
MMTAIWIGVGVLVALAAVPALAGLGLPREHRSAVEAQFHHSPSAVWDVIADYQRHPVSGPMARKVEPVEEGGLPSWREDLGRTVVTVRTVEADPPRRLVRTMQDAVVPMTARWAYELAPSGPGTRVRLSQEIAIDSGNWRTPFFRIMIRLFPAGGPKAHLAAVARTLGDSVQIEIPRA